MLIVLDDHQMNLLVSSTVTKQANTHTERWYGKFITTLIAHRKSVHKNTVRSARRNQNKRVQKCISIENLETSIKLLCTDINYSARSFSKARRPTTHLHNQHINESTQPLPPCRRCNSLTRMVYHSCHHAPHRH